MYAFYVESQNQQVVVNANSHVEAINLALAIFRQDDPDACVRLSRGATQDEIQHAYNERVAKDCAGETPFGV